MTNIEKMNYLNLNMEFISWYSQQSGIIGVEQIAYWWNSEIDTLLQSERTRIAEEVEEIPYVRDISVVRFRNEVLSIIKQGK